MAHSKAFQYESPFDINHLISNYGGALDYPARVIIMRWLAREGPKSASEITKHIELSKSTTSHHLASLVRFGLIIGTERGPHITYQFNWSGYHAMRHFMTLFFDELDSLEQKDEK